MPSMLDTRAKIDSFQSLTKGWHYGTGKTIGLKLRQIAISFIEFAEQNGISRSDAFPGENGEIGLSFYRGKGTLAITLEPDNTFHVITDINNEIIDEFYEIDEPEAKLKLWEFSHQSRSSSTSSIFPNGRLNDGGLAMLRLSARQRQQTPTEEYPQFPQNVLEVRPQPYVATSPYTTIQISSATR